MLIYQATYWRTVVDQMDQLQKENKALTEALVLLNEEIESLRLLAVQVLRRMPDLTSFDTIVADARRACAGMDG